MKVNRGRVANGPIAIMIAQKMAVMVMQLPIVYDRSSQLTIRKFAGKLVIESAVGFCYNEAYIFSSILSPADNTFTL